MTVTSVKRLYEPCGAEATLTAQSDGTIKIVRTYQDTYRVTVDSVLDGPYTVGSAVGPTDSIPLLGASHWEDSSATVRKITPKRESGVKLAWLVTVDYSTETPDPNEAEENPLLKPVIRSKRSNKVEVPLIVDLNGDKVLNTAGMQPTTPVLVQRSWGIYTFKKNYAVFNDTFADALEDALNSHSFLGKPPGTVRCNTVDMEEVYEGQWHYFPVTFEFEYNANGWDPVVLNDGFHELENDGGTYKLKRICDDKGEPVSEPFPLDINGLKIPAATLQANPNAVITREWKGYERYDFNNLRLQ